MSEDNSAGGARRGDRRNNQRNDRNGNDRNGDRNGDNRKTAKYTNKIDGLLGLKLLKYVKTSVGKSGSMTKVWARGYLSS